VARVPGGFGVNDVRGVRSRPSRAVSLSDVRDLPVQRMGFDFDEFDRLISEGTSEEEWNPWDLVVDPETGELVERGSGHLEPDHEETGGVPGRRLTEEEYEQHRRRQARRMLERLDEENITEEDFRRWTRGEAPLFSPDEDRSVGLSARDRALVQSPLAMAGGGQESLPGLSPEEIQYDINRRGIDEARRILEEARRRAEEKAKQPRPAGPPPQQGPPIPPRPDQLDAIRYALLAAGVGGAGMGAMRTFGGGGILGGLGSGMSLR